MILGSMNTSRGVGLVIGALVVVLFAFDSVQGTAVDCYIGKNQCENRENCTLGNSTHEVVFCCPDDDKGYTITVKEENDGRFGPCKCVRGEAVGKRCGSTGHILSASFLTCVVAILLGTISKAFSSPGDHLSGL